MILDQLQNAKRYLGISRELDMALCALEKMDYAAQKLGRIQLTQRSYYNVSENRLAAQREEFEFHHRYADIHVPLSGEEQLAITPIALMPEDTAFDAEKDFGLFAGPEINVVRVPVGHFCICFPEDAHKPLLGEEGKIIRKIVFKVDMTE